MYAMNQMGSGNHHNLMPISSQKWAVLFVSEGEFAAIILS